MDIFQFKKFKIIQNAASVFKVNTEAVLLSAWVCLKSNIKILEIGSGTGVISLGLIQRLDGKSDITAIDIDHNAYKLTKENIAYNQVTNISVQHTSLQEFSRKNPNQRFDLIISNPPYFDSKYKSVKPRNVYAKYTDTLDYKTLMELSSKMLNPEGKIALVLPYHDLEKIKSEINQNKLDISRLLYLSTIPNKVPLRILIEIKFQDLIKKTVSHHLIIKDGEGKFTNEYIDYTKEYYTIF